MWGDKQTIMVEAGDDSLLSETRVVRFQGQTAWIRSLGNNHRGLTRLQFGGNFADEFDKLPPSLRFFAGGITVSVVMGMSLSLLEIKVVH
ncbi:hypothetical protein QWY96_08355 [Vibrio artabrorum]|uniref:Uncharacterized protein n=1 Tax=Vibrio artabrorum TaxID=446374 RepID=A0ABT8CK33_9VIBR|nr:hypothetical protein [Vibrio artabrorum]MDN3700904.1 hypothetical protein [Vibrio artabrorum]